MWHRFLEYFTYEAGYKTTDGWTNKVKQFTHWEGGVGVGCGNHIIICSTDTQQF